MIGRDSIILLLIEVTMLVGIAPDVAGQGATLMHREDVLLMMIRDRQGSIGGLWFDRGILRPYMPDMDHEYYLDLRGAAFTGEDDAVWHNSDSAVRTYAASINKSEFATTTDIRHRLTWADRHVVTLRGRQQEDLQARRFFIEGGYAFEVAATHFLGFTQTMARFKPDLDTELFYEARGTPAGNVRASIFFLDAFNNAIFDGLGVDPVLQDTLRSYHRPPRLLRVRWLSPRFGQVSFEAFAGVQPESEAAVSTHSNPDYEFVVEQRIGYGMMNVRVDVGRFVTSAYLTTWEERTAYSAPEGSSAYRRYATRQREMRFGLRGHGVLPVTRQGGIEALADVSLVQFRDRQTGDNFSGARVDQPFYLVEDRVEAEARLAWTPRRKGVRAGLRWLSDHRSYNEDLAVLERRFLRFAQWTPNTRLSLLLGYDFQPWFRLETGVSFDVDGDRFYTDRGITRFDGGFGRVQVVW